MSKEGKGYRKFILEPEIFRIIRFRPAHKCEDIMLITNILHLTTQAIATMYRRRWDIEMFFRFLKQKVNFSHFISLNENGIKIILYMILIVAMLKTELQNSLPNVFLYFVFEHPLRLCCKK